ASGGAQMPILIVDLILWGLGCHEQEYNGYVDDNLQYSPFLLRERVKTFGGKLSIIESVNEAVRRGVREENKRYALASIRALIGFTDTLLRYRGPHFNVAKKNFDLRPKGSVGSGGYGLEKPWSLLLKTEDAKRNLEGSLRSLESAR